MQCAECKKEITDKILCEFKIGQLTEYYERDGTLVETVKDSPAFLHRDCAAAYVTDVA